MILLGLEYWWLLPAAVCLDALWGDPRLPWPHPVCWIGALLRWMEPVARRWGASRALGAICVFIVAALSGSVVWVLSHVPVLGPVFALYFAWAGLAARSLYTTVARVCIAADTAPLPQAQAALAALVSRDTGVLDREGLYKSLADTLAENHTDAVIAPLFWLAVGGPAGLWIYKAVSTVDSMWGYTTSQWRSLGWAGARLDDILAWLPARYGVLCLWAAYMLSPRFLQWNGRWPGIRCIARQAGGMASPNSGWSMSAAAWLLNAPLGGPTVYFGKMMDKPWVGPPVASSRQIEPSQGWSAPRINALNDLTRSAGYVAALDVYMWLVLVWIVLR